MLVQFDAELSIYRRQYWKRFLERIEARTGWSPAGGSSSKNNIFDGTLNFDVDQKYYDVFTQTETLNIVVNSNTNGQSSWQYIPLITNGNSINVPANWVLIGADEYNNDAARYDIVVWFTGSEYQYRLYRVSDVPALNPSLLESIILNSATDAINITFDRPVNISILGWSIATDGAALSIVSVSGSGTNYPIVQLSRAVVGEETITLSYVESTGDTKDLDNNPLEDITDFAIENRVEIDLAAELGADLLRWYRDSRVSTNRIDDNTGTPSCNEWIDSSANSSNAVQSTKAEQPILTVSGIKFDGSDDSLRDTLSLGACEIFLVHKFDTDSVANRLLIATQGSNNIWMRNSGNETVLTLYSFGNGTFINGSGLSSTGFNVLQSIIDGANSEFNLTGGDFGPAMATTTFSLGSNDGSSVTSDYLVEVVITELLSSSDRVKVIAHLNQVKNA